MKDITIKGKSLHRELFVLLGCFIAVNLWNIYAIITYNTSWWELLSVWYAVLFVTLVLYILSLPIRWVGCWIGKIVCCRCKKKSSTCGS